MRVLHYDQQLRSPAAQSLREPSISSAVNNAPPASVAQSIRESRVSASTERSMKHRVTSTEVLFWDWFEKLPFDYRLGLRLDSLTKFLSIKERFQNSRSSSSIRDWVHRRCYFDYNISFLYNNRFDYELSQVLAFAPDIGSGRFCTCEDTCNDSSHESISPIAEIYPPRKKAQLRSQVDSGIDGQGRRIMLVDHQLQDESFRG